MNRAFWQDRQVLVTGHTGFKGGWLALWLNRLGARVSGFAQLPPTSPSLFETADVASALTSVTGDVVDARAGLDQLTKYDPVSADGGPVEGGIAQLVFLVGERRVAFQQRADGFVLNVVVAGHRCASDRTARSRS